MGAVARVYRPGCKFDYMMVLVSDQGIGKSTFLRMLCINDAWFNDNFSTLDGDKAVEKLRGMWIVELAELQATKRSKDVETIKAFITSRVDTYRVPYGRRTEQRPRMCVLCGTSNPTDFLTDRTGNRRFLPITCGVRPVEFDIFADETSTRMEFAQAWGEIMDEYMRKGGKVSLVLPKRLQKVAVDMQERYQEEDPRVGIIQEWLDGTDAEHINRRLGEIARDYVFQSREIKLIEISAERILNYLLDCFVRAAIHYDTDVEMSPVDSRLMVLVSDNYKMIYDIYSKGKDPVEKLYLRLLLVTDYVCGMTDSYAQDLYQRLNGRI